MILKQAHFAYVNHAWNQPVQSNEGKVSCSRKQWEPLMGLELTPDRHPPIASQTRDPLGQANPVPCKVINKYPGPNFIIKDLPSV